MPSPTDPRVWARNLDFIGDSAPPARLERARHLLFSHFSSRRAADFPSAESPGFLTGSLMRISAATGLLHASRSAELARAKATAKRNKLLIDKLAKSISVTTASGAQDARLNSAQGAPLDRNSAIERISRLVEFIQSRSLQGSESDEQAVNGALQEIGRLIGMPVQPGGSGRALVSGINSQQIESYEVISLRPNAKTTLSGTIHGGRKSAVENNLDVLGQLGWRIVTTDVTGLNQNQIGTLNAGLLQPGSEVAVSGSFDVALANAALIYQGAGGALASGSALFRIIGPEGSENFSITAGEPLSDVAQRINDQSSSTGVLAAVQGNTIALQTIATGAAAAIVVDNIVRDSVVSVSALNGAQVDEFEVVNIPDETQITLNGNVTQPATRATLTYVGAPGGVVIDSATFTLSGDLGSAPVSIVQGESLAGVANRINLLAQTTGVSAAASGDNLIFSSLNVGSAADLAIERNQITQYLNVSGVNPAQITNFQVQSADPDSVNTLSGSVTQAASAAQLTYTGGFGGRITANASFTLTGSLGSANFSVTLLETLTAVRDRINLQTATTGVTASVSGNNLFLTSTGVGSAATVARVVTSGTFNVTGGNGNGTANGTNAQLLINGQPVTAAGNNVSYSDSLGSYTFTVVDGFTGAFNPITITSANGTFNITGGDGNGADTGTDAAATINSQPLTGSGNLFTINTGGGQFTLELTDGFSGVLDPVVITSSLADFTISGGNGDATANGIDAEATINGQSLTSAGRVFTLPTPGGNLIIGFQNAFLGAFDPFTVAIREQSLPSADVGSPTRSSGRAAKATINGRTVKQKNGRFFVTQDGVAIAIKFKRGFSGKFDDITVATAGGEESDSANSILNKADEARVRSLIEPLLSLASGGENSNLGQTGGRAFRLAASALHELASLRSGNLTTNPRSLTSGALLDQVA